MHRSQRPAVLAAPTGAFAVGAAAVWLLNEDRGREAAASLAEQGGPLRQQGSLNDSHGENHLVNWCANSWQGCMLAVSASLLTARTGHCASGRAVVAASCCIIARLCERTQTQWRLTHNAIKE